MPDFGVILTDPAINRSDGLSVGWKLFGGGRFSTSLSGLGGDALPDPGQASALRQAMGNASNAAVIRMVEKRDTFISETHPTVVVFDEAYSDGAFLKMVFQNNNGEIVDYELPNPDASMFTGNILKTPDAAGDSGQQLLDALISASETFINNTYTPANSYSFLRGNYRSGKIRKARQVSVPTVAEPDDVAGDLPGDAPAT